MSIGPELPTLEQLKSIAKDCGVELSNELATDYLDMMVTTFKSYRRIDQLVERKLPVKYPRTPGYRPAADENPLNAWYWRCDIPGASDGILAGERIAVKDTVCVAGVPMMNGSKLLEGYVPDVDATIVTRMLDAGATIVGKASCEDFSFSAGGMTCSYGPVGNPWKPDHNPGASSNGSAVLISQGQVDLAIGGDQGGSIRLPAAMSGCYGLKPTFGLVPYTGCAMIEATLDHVGPMASTTRGIAKLLTAIAGFDADDPRQQGRVAPGFDTNYMPALGRGVDGLKIGVLKEGFGQDGSEYGLITSEPEVDECVRAAVEKLRTLGATVEDVSIPEHLDAYPLWTAIAIEGASAFMLNGHGLGTNWQGWYNTAMGEHLARGMRSRPHDLPPTVLSVLLSGEYMRKFYFNRYYAKAQNMRHIVTDAYNAMLRKYDIIVCPTTPHRATLMADRDDLPSTLVGNALDQLRNTVVADLTGHPAISIPCGVRDGLPIGMMLTSRHFDEHTLIAASAAFESLGDWKTM
ncbi:amidase [Paraburkholderia tropica]|uniref:Amidase n=1 Tax=Paraburkholderia tropica TaxID=92647 RepID=A0AAQ1GDE4_9BURK|nr:amidase [Paraburkholderia tropica]RQN40296.1 amidase [Paraburkholderia tropica]SEJ33013.1 amidase [Paraburkholderia tropica]